jgi:predicted membrane channel-forming protein YqfA (hemolysin III family)
MTDYELLTVTIEFINIVWAIFATYVSIVFAFIVASHLVAKKLTPRVVSLVITLYTLVAVWAVWGISMNAFAISATGAEMKRRLVEESSSLGWLPMLEMPDIMRSTVPFLITLLGIVVYAGSIIFFFNRRREEQPSKTSE